MGHRFPRQCLLPSKFHVIFGIALSLVLLFLDGIQSTDLHTDGRRVAVDDKAYKGFSHVRRIAPRVLHKRSIPVESTFLPTQKGNHLNEISVELPLDSRTEWLDLSLNWDLVSEGYFVRYQSNGSDIVHRPNAETADLCHYQGKIRGKPSSWAAVSTCDGMSGVVFDGEHLHHLEPFWSRDLNDSVSGLSRWETLHYRQGDLRRNFTCDHGGINKSEKGFLDQYSQNLVDPLKALSSSVAATDSVDVPSASTKATSKVKRGVKTDGYHEPFDSDGKSRYVEIVIVVDNKKHKELGSDLKKTVARTKEISNIVNALYAPLNIYIALVGVVVWTEMDEIELTSNGDETLARFLHYRRERLVKDHPNDNAQLLTAVEFDHGVVGKAMQGPICSYKYSGGVNSDYRAVTGVVASTIAHELGHNFGMAHDTEECKCPGPTGRCIMSASSSSNRTSHWSSCSLENLAYAFAHGMDYCLRNKPKRLFESPVCGNGFTEEGEECDCGIADSESCTKNTCCNPNTCKLYPNATCGAGTCCDLSTCHFKAGGTVCRSSSNTCDLPEYCSGESEFCPDDVNKLNGLECETSNGKAYCYEGKCRTHTDQCRLLWGPSGNNSDNLCYQKNTNGSRYGNCGYDLATGAYTPCQTEDTKCGRLHCRYLQEKLEFGYEPVAQLSSFFVNAQGNIHPCRSVSVDFGTQDVDPGLAPDGAVCGTGKMCVKQKCVSVESIVAPFKCPGGCGSNGVCNSKGHCHCDEGYGGTTCSGSGLGGSVDSGPAIDPFATSIFAKSLYVTFLGFIPLIAIISFYIYYANENFKKLCQRGRAVALPRNRQNNNKPQANGGVALRPLEISNPTPAPGSNNNTKMTTPDDFFGKYKGFSLAPLKQASDISSSNDTTDSSIKNVNNNTASPPASNIRAGNGNTVSSTVNANVYYSPLPTQTINETLVKNHNEKSTIKSYTHSFLPKNMTRVSWAQPIAQPLPTNSPGSEDETGVTNDSPLYSNVRPSNSDATKSRPSSSADPVNGNKETVHETENISQTASTDQLNKAESGGVGPEKSRGLSAGLSRIAGALPFVRNSLRNLTTFHHEDSNKNSCSKQNKISGKKNLEISTPILQGDGVQASKLHSLISVSKESDGKKMEDEMDYVNAAAGTKKTSKGRYANVPLIDESPVKTANPTIQEAQQQQWIKPSTVDKLRGESKLQERKPVLRAHSMIQPNRNSMHSSNTNYNSLRRSRPSVPPPKPPGAPPPPPPASLISQQPPNSPLPAIPKARSESPPPITKPKSVLRPTVTGSNISSILKSFGRNNSGSNIRESLAAPAEPKGPAPIAKLDIDPQSPVSPPTSTSSGTGVDNIYDEIKEGKDETVKSEEKVETLSTGSSESAGGLLSEIIFEIQNRNKESIYNSVDRRKRKKEEAAHKQKPPVAENKPTQLAKKPSSPKLSPKLKPKKPSVPMQPYIKPVFKDALKSRASPSPPMPESTPPAAPATVFNKLSNLKRAESPGPKIAMSVTSSSDATSLPSNATAAPSVPALLSKPAVSVASSVPANSIAKPMCAVNGVPKVTSSPSYVAKINYFSNLSSNKSDSPMKPLNSLNTTLTDTKQAVASSIYAPSSITAPEPSHLSTIRPTYARPYVNNKLASEVTNENDDSSSGGATSVRTAGIFAPNTGSEYGTLGRNKGRKILEEKPPEVKPPSEPLPAAGQQGYKSFNPYLNRPLTFSTFRPNNSAATAKTALTETAATSNNQPTPALTSAKPALSFSTPKPAGVNVCSIKQQPYGTDTARGVRSPARVVQ